MGEYSKETVLKTVSELFDMVKDQQSKIEQMERENKKLDGFFCSALKRWKEVDEEKAHLAEMNKRYLGKMQEQLDQIESAKDVIKKHDRYIPQSAIDALEKALRGES